MSKDKYIFKISFEKNWFKRGDQLLNSNNELCTVLKVYNPDIWYKRFLRWIGFKYSWLYFRGVKAYTNWSFRNE